ncbi:ATP-binding protein [Candidatus Woesearchaeota archaeon]|nr:ATP-binding protein [Candidatus Woesearchaeota archaeon]
MTTLDTFIQEEDYKMFNSRRILWKLRGWDIKLTTTVEQGTYRDYSDAITYEIGVALREFVRNGFKAIYGVGAPMYEIDDLEAQERAKSIPARLSIELSQTENNYVIAVSDNGRGIMLQDRNRLFEEGFSTCGTTGIGLPAARENVCQFGGRIYFNTHCWGDHLEDENITGTTFYLALPK